MKTLVTGGAGFIGSHVVSKLLGRGIDVYVYDLASVRHRTPEGGAVFIPGSILDLESLRGAMAGMDAVYHLAAIADVADVFEDPYYAETVNVRGTATVLEAARRAKVSRVIYGSTTWVYSGADADIVDEDTPLHPPDHLYTATKLTSEYYCVSYDRLYGLATTILRYGIPYGPRARDAAVIPVRLGDTDNGRHLFFYINRILNDASPLERYGKKYKVVRIEDLGREEILQALTGWLDISYHQCLTRSTWAGLTWHGDKLSKVNDEPGFSKGMLDNQWERRLSFTDKYVMNYIMNPRLKHYGYSHSGASFLGALVIPFLILLPLSYEFRFVSPSYIRDRLRDGQFGTVVRNGLNYLKRIRVFLKFYLRTTVRGKFQQPVLMAEPATALTTSVEEK